jgi:hypothetical protein
MGFEGELTVKTTVAGIAALSLAVTGTAFAGEGNGPDFPAYNAGVAAVEYHYLWWRVTGTYGFVPNRNSLASFIPQ